MSSSELAHAWIDDLVWAGSQPRTAPPPADDAAEHKAATSADTSARARALLGGLALALPAHRELPASVTKALEEAVDRADLAVDPWVLVDQPIGALLVLGATGIDPADYPLFTAQFIETMRARDAERAKLLIDEQLEAMRREAQGFQFPWGWSILAVAGGAAWWKRKDLRALFDRLRP